MTGLALTGTPDRPRTAYRVLERRATVTTVGVLLVLTGLSWWSTVGNAADMRGMVSGVADVGTGMPFDLGVPVFLGMWLAMTVAMMLPTVAPVVLLHRMVVRRRGGGLVPTAAFVAGYLAVWSAAGVVPLGVLVGFRDVAEHTAWVDRAGGAVLVLVGLYQFTRWKEVCARACRSPLSFLATHDFGAGTSGAVRAGLSHGAYCLGCCWGLMAVLLVVGLMNLVWMAGVAVVFLVEKHWQRGQVLAYVVGSAVLVLGAVVLVQPSVLGDVAGTAAGTSMTAGMP